VVLLSLIVKLDLLEFILDLRNLDACFDILNIIE